MMSMKYARRYLARKMTLFNVLLFAIPTVLLGCGSFGGNDNEFIQTPVFTLQMSPPIGWTFFPAIPSDGTVGTVNYFVGQSNDSTTAQNRANNEIIASVIEAMSSINMPVNNIQVTNDYKPIQVENPGATPKGTLYGKVEGGALTQTAPGVQTGTLVYQPYHVQVKITVTRSIGNTRFNWNIVKNTLLQTLSINYNAKIVGEAIVSSS